MQTKIPNYFKISASLRIWFAIELWPPQPASQLSCRQIPRFTLSFVAFPNDWDLRSPRNRQDR